MRDFQQLGNLTLNIFHIKEGIDKELYTYGAQHEKSVQGISIKAKRIFLQDIFMDFLFLV